MLFSTQTFAVALLALPLVTASNQMPRKHNGSPTINERSLTGVVDSLLPFNAKKAAATPAFVAPAAPKLLNVAQLLGYVGAVTSPATSALMVALSASTTSLKAGNAGGVLNAVANAVPNAVCGLLGCATSTAASPIASALASSTITCLDSTVNETVINSLFYYGGADTTVYLCPSAQINTQDVIWYTAPRQVLTTKGLPLALTRATIRVTGQSQTCAIFGVCNDCSGIKLTNVIIDGNRPNLNWASGLGLIEFGGNNIGQVIDNIAAFEPRAWTALHLIEGYDNSCTGATVTNSQIGPSGHAPSGVDQFRMLKQRRDIGTYPPGEWADGISCACKGSIIKNNIVTDATDGAIVLFGAPGTIVSGNKIIASQRQLLGAINMVDYWPFAGDFSSVSVTGNTIDAQGSMIKVGLAIGTLTWGDYNSTDYQNSGGSVTGNTLTSTGLGYFGYGSSVDGHNGIKVASNVFTKANFGGTVGSRCEQVVPFGPAYYNPYTTANNNLQKLYVNGGAFNFMICNGPGPISQAAFSSS